MVLFFFRSDRDMYVKINWENIRDGRKDQFMTFRWTTGYGEKYDYASILHYSSGAFSRDPDDPDALTIVPVDGAATPASDLGRRQNLSATDAAKIRKMYKCEPYADWRNDCSGGVLTGPVEGECGVNEFCDSYVLGGQCRTRLPAGSLCLSSDQCLRGSCVLGRCSQCATDADCAADVGAGSDYCAYKWVPMVEKWCSKFCGEFCLTSLECGGECPNCELWSFRCVA